jgi:hypothetical protein
MESVQVSEVPEMFGNRWTFLSIFGTYSTIFQKLVSSLIKKKKPFPKDFNKRHRIYKPFSLKYGFVAFALLLGAFLLSATCKMVRNPRAVVQEDKKKKKRKKKGGAKRASERIRKLKDQPEHAPQVWQDRRMRAGGSKKRKKRKAEKHFYMKKAQEDFDYNEDGPTSTCAGGEAPNCWIEPSCTTSGCVASGSAASSGDQAASRSLSENWDRWDVSADA